MRLDGAYFGKGERDAGQRSGRGTVRL